MRLYVGPSGRTVPMIKAPVTVPSRVASHVDSRRRGDAGYAGSESLDPLALAGLGGRQKPLPTFPA